VAIEEELSVGDGSAPNNPWLSLIVYRGRTSDRRQGR
jgi:hypothetical protein